MKTNNERKSLAGLLLALSTALAAPYASAQQAVEPPAVPSVAPKAEEHKKKQWFETLAFRGYAQLRYNRLLESNRLLDCEQCDRSLGTNKSFFFRRARLVLSGDVHERVALYFQTDFANEVAGNQNYAQIRDLYADIALDQAKEFRLRPGQSKVPFGFENLQSSQNRLALDRADPLNSGVANERDLGVFFYYAPAHIRKRFSELVSSGLKGSGDYGVLGLGAYNGQTANKPEANNSLHYVARLTYPFQLPNGQYIEPGIQGYTGRFVPTSRTAGVLGDNELRDYRGAVSLMIYPQPIGLQAEYNWGEGPEYDAPTNTIRRRPLLGGYVQTMYMLKVKDHVITPFVKAQYYKGGKKHEQDARRYIVRELEMGAEWQPFKAFELTALWSLEDRSYEDRATRGNRQKGSRLRVQAQVNF
jgi:hypothetical protein